MGIYKKRKIIIIIIVAFILIIFRIVTNKSNNEKVETYIKKIGFKKQKDSDLYYKQISDINLDQFFKLVEGDTYADTSYLYFDLNNYHLIKVNMQYSNEVTSTLTATYNYKKDKLTYIYEVTGGDVSAMFEGEYMVEKKAFICEESYYNNIDVYEDNNKEIICDKIELDIGEFYEELRHLITNPNLLNKMKEKSK